MALQNRVTPGGEIITTSARGTVMGNRGILHDENKQIVRTSRNTMWLTCRLDFKGRKRQLMGPGTYTELFFLDDRAFIVAANVDNDNPLSGPTDLDRRLNESRRAPRMTAPIVALPDGVFITLGDADFRLIWNGALHRWSPEGYVDPIAITDAGSEKAVVVTPSLSVTALRHGYPVEVHPSAVLEERTSQTDRIDFGASTVQPSKDSAGLTNAGRILFARSSVVPATHKRRDHRDGCLCQSEPGSGVTVC